MTVESCDLHEDPERPGLFVPDSGELVRLTNKDSVSFTHTMIDGVAMPWAHGTLVRDAHTTEEEINP